MKLTDKARILDGRPVPKIHSNLTSGVDVTRARRLPANVEMAYMGDTKGGAFEIPDRGAVEMLMLPNPTGRPNSDALVPWANGFDVTRRRRCMWITDFGVGINLETAAGYEAPFRFVETRVRSTRAESRTTIASWWLHERPRPEMRAALGNLPRFLATTTVSKHRLFVWMNAPTLPDHQLIVFARSDDLFFGVLQSRIHEVWALALGTQLETRPRYTPTTCFETFPLPEGLPDQTVAEATRDLDALRCRWLDPPEWTREEVLEFPGSVGGPWARFVHGPDDRGIGTVRYCRLVAKDEQCARKLAARTLTSLYNERPTWLEQAHRRLDEAVLAAYGWDSGMSDTELLERLLELNLSRAAAGEGRRGPVSR